MAPLLDHEGMPACPVNDTSIKVYGIKPPVVRSGICRVRNWQHCPPGTDAASLFSPSALGHLAL